MTMATRIGTRSAGDRFLLDKIAKRKGMSDRDIKAFLKKDQLPEAYSWLGTS